MVGGRGWVVLTCGRVLVLHLAAIVYSSSPLLTIPEAAPMDFSAFLLQLPVILILIAVALVSSPV